MLVFYQICLLFVGDLLLLLNNVEVRALIPDPCLRRVRDSRPLFTPCPGEDLTVSLFWHMIQIDGVFGMFRQMWTFVFPRHLTWGTCRSISRYRNLHTFPSWLMTSPCTDPLGIPGHRDVVFPSLRWMEFPCPCVKLSLVFQFSSYQSSMYKRIAIFLLSIHNISSWTIMFWDYFVFPKAGPLR